LNKQKGRLKTGLRFQTTFLFTLKLCYEKLSVGELFLPDTVFFWHFLMRQWFHQELLAFQNFVILRKY